MAKWSLFMKDLLGLGAGKIQANGLHLEQAMGWLERAQQATPDKGVSRLFSLSNRWASSYPEVTGYIIPTFIRYGKFSGNASYTGKALEMADWLLDIQMECGAIQAGMVDATPRVPTVFNTGQILFGLISAFRETANERYLDGAIKAGNWLTAVQEPDGSWKKFSSPYGRYTDNTYNARTAWGLLLLHEVTGRSRYLDATVKNIRRALIKQNERGWFLDNCLSDNEKPLTHTIGYTLEGLLGVGLSLGEREFTKAAEKVGRALVLCQAEDGSLSGRLDCQWRPSVRWRCLTGIAQIAICWSRLYEATGDTIFRKAALRANRYLKSKQSMENSFPEIRGGLKGSHPIHGDYCPFEYPSWAAKFFVDSLLLEEQLIT